MPGVPSGKGCDACRKQKKKCDIGKPSCSRCTRLRIPCIGAGQQRYKFKDTSKTLKRANSSGSGTEQPSENTTPDPDAAASNEILRRSPSNDISALASALVQAMKPETSWRFNIAYAYGGFVTLIPQRLGRNAALDASVAALTEAHADFCSHRPASRSVLGKYSTALTKLRICLNDPQVATQSETLASVMILLITQSFIGTGGTRPAASHVVGMARLLKVRGTHHDPNDSFESMLLLTLRGPVVFEGLWNDSVEFSESQWKALVENHWDNDQRPEGILMRCMAKMPVLILRGRRVLRGETIDSTLAQEVSTVFHQLLESGNQLRERLDLLAQKILCSGPEISTLVALQEAAIRIHSFQVAVVIIAGCVLGVVTSFTTELQTVLNACASEVLSYVPVTQKWRPLGSSYMLLALSAAWTGTNDPDLKLKLQNAYLDQYRDFPVDLDYDSVVEALEEGADRFLNLGMKPRASANTTPAIEEARSNFAIRTNRTYAI